MYAVSRLGDYNAAADVLRRAVELRPNSLMAIESLENVYNAMVQRWHFTMLNDIERNKHFKRAISKAIDFGRRHKSVLDIGTGTGILSMFAVQSSASHVYACEMSKPMYEIANKCLEASQMKDKVKLFNEKSTNLKIPEHIPERVSLVITETVDSGLFGENILETLIHAWDHLLVPRDKGGAVLPESATICACAIESIHVRRCSRMLPESLKLWNMPDKIVMASTECSPYESEKMSRIFGGYNALSHPMKLLYVDFNNVEDLRDIKILESEAILTCTMNGIFDAVAIWFDLRLNDDETISTSPESNTCWEVAVQYVQSPDPVEICRGDKINLKMKYIKRHLDVSISCECLEDVDEECIYLEREIIEQFNDIVVQSALKKSFHLAINKLTSSEDEIRLLTISRLPLLSTYACSLDRVTKVAVVDEEEMNLVKKLSTNEGGPNLSHNKLIVDFQSINCNPEIKGWNIVMASIVERNGLLDLTQLKNISMMTKLYKETIKIVIPNRLRCVAVLVESQTIKEMHHIVNDCRTLGLKIRKEINAYSVSVHQDLDLTTLPHKKLSHPITVLDLDFAAIRDLPSFSAYCRCVPIKVKHSGRINAIAFWFELAMIDDIILSTLDTNGTGGGYWHQSAFVLTREQQVKNNETVILRTTFIEDHLKLEVLR